MEFLQRGRRLRPDLIPQGQQGHRQSLSIAALAEHHNGLALPLQ